MLRGGMTNRVSELVELYRSLDPKERAELRRELLQRAEKDEVERHLSEVVEARERFPTQPGEQLHEFEPLSDDLLKWFTELRDMLGAYVPKDRYQRGDEH